MSPLASVAITSALILYTIGVWSERLQGRLRPWHLAFFWAGLVCDTVGTGVMIDFVGGLTADVHGITGVIAILLMLVHAVWATVVLVRRDERMIRTFHRFSIVVWLVWLVPYFSPMFVAIADRPR
ncbi:MAG: HsmA family protein [Chloroflexota bacterium]